MVRSWALQSQSSSLYHKAIVDGAISKGVVVDFLPFDAFIAGLRIYCMQAPNSTEDVCLLLDVWNRELLDDIIRVLLVPTISRRPGLVLISSVLTWAGKRYNNPITDFASEFVARRPAACAHNAWLSENSFWNMVCRTKSNAVIISLGAAYGLSGYHCADIFR